MKKSKEKDLKKIVEDIDEELKRVKDFTKKNDYDHDTAINFIVSEYRRKLKRYGMKVAGDLNDEYLEKYTKDKTLKDVKPLKG